MDGETVREIFQKVCGSCGNSREEKKFSENQWTKRSHRRCQACIAADVPLMMPEEQTQFKLGKHSGVFCSNEISDEVVSNKDDAGNVMVDITEILPNSRDLCGNYDCSKKATKDCSRCNRISYCSKACSTKDWRRHKKTECLKKQKRLLRSDLDAEETKKATEMACNKISKTLQQMHLTNASGKVDTWAKDIGLGNKIQHGPAFDDGPLSSAVVGTIMRYYPQIASFAALHIAEYPRLKGALFLFTKISIYDFVSEEKEAKQLDRMFILAWGCRYITGETHHPHFHIQALADKFLSSITKLPHFMKTACDEISFPLVICADPTGQTIPAEIDALLRPPKGVDPVDYTHDTPSFTYNCPMRFFDFNALLDLGRSAPEAECVFYNMDRKEGDPTD